MAIAWSRSLASAGKIPANTSLLSMNGPSVTMPPFRIVVAMPTIKLGHIFAA
ncbi:hypothetical protein ABZU75_25750 [Streptosporangium sp. NPDC005286]|uniref:hypothetical protein n=1 Tax=Streptosporangium sp. NPDC005286 TaxID=3154463 RepID=UPI0033B6CE09